MNKHWIVFMDHICDAMLEMHMSDKDVMHIIFENEDDFNKISNGFLELAPMYYANHSISKDIVVYRNFRFLFSYKPYTNA